MSKLTFSKIADGRYIVTHPDKAVIPYDELVNLQSFLNKKQKEFIKNKSTDGRPIWVDCFTTIRDIMIAYQSQLSRQQRRKLEREEGKFYKKAETNRMKNQSNKKKIDNLRYLIARAARCSSINFFPAGFYGSDGMINFLDRGNVSEEQAESVKTDGGKEFTKKEILSAISEIKESLLDDTPSTIKEWENKVTTFTNDKKYNLFQVIGKSGIDSILDEVVNIKIMISTESQSVNEMVNFNGKNNPWVFLHFMFQYLDIRNKFQNDEIFKILSEKGKYLNLKDFIGYKEGKTEHPEILPFLPTAITFISNSIKDYNWETANKDEEDKLKEKLKLAFISLGSQTSSNQQKVKDYYDKFVPKGKDLSEFHSEVEKVAKVLDKMIVDESMNNVIEHYNKLKKAVNHVIHSDNQSEDKKNHAESFIQARFIDLIKKDSIKLIYAIALGSHNPKFTLEDTSYSNVESFLSNLEYELTNGINITPSANGVDFIDYSITNDELEKMFKSQAGSWDGKLELIFPFIKNVVIKVRETIGTDTNIKHKQKELALIKRATGLSKEAWWVESDTSGNFVKIGMLDGKLTLSSSWQHLDDKDNNWEVGCIEETTSNSGGRRIKKPNKLKSYERKLENIQQWYDEKSISKTDYKQSSRVLEDIIEEIKEEQI